MPQLRLRSGRKLSTFVLWLAAAPIVALGAPLGAVVVELISRKPTLLVVSTFCVGQFVWTLIDEQVSGLGLVLSLLGVLACNGVFLALYSLGRSPGPDGDASPEQLATNLEVCLENP